MRKIMKKKFSAKKRNFNDLEARQSNKDFILECLERVPVGKTRESLHSIIFDTIAEAHQNGLLASFYINENEITCSISEDPDWSENEELFEEEKTYKSKFNIEDIFETLDLDPNQLEDLFAELLEDYLA